MVVFVLSSPGTGGLHVEGRPTRPVTCPHRPSGQLGERPALRVRGHAMALWEPSPSPYYACKDGDALPAGCEWDLGRPAADAPLLLASAPLCIVDNRSLHQLHLLQPSATARRPAEMVCKRAPEASARQIVSRQLGYFRAEHPGVFAPADVLEPLLLQSIVREAECGGSNQPQPRNQSNHRTHAAAHSRSHACPSLPPTPPARAPPSASPDGSRLLPRHTHHRAGRQFARRYPI